MRILLDTHAFLWTAIEEKIAILSCDVAFDAYGIQRLW